MPIKGNPVLTPKGILNSEFRGAYLTCCGVSYLNNSDEALKHLHTFHKSSDKAHPISDLAPSTVEQYLNYNGFYQQEVTGLPSPKEAPQGESTFSHRDGRTVILHLELDSDSNLAVVGVRATQAGEDRGTIESPRQLIEFVRLGQEVSAPEKGGEEVKQE